MPSSFCAAIGPLQPTRVDLQAMFNRDGRHEVDFADVRGQDGTKRALEVRRRGRPQRPDGWSARAPGRRCWRSASARSCRR
jgi:hypothetical protein